MVIREVHTDLYSADYCNQLRDPYQSNQSSLLSKMLTIRAF